MSSSVAIASSADDGGAGLGRAPGIACWAQVWRLRSVAFVALVKPRLASVFVTDRSCHIGRLRRSTAALSAAAIVRRAWTLRLAARALALPAMRSRAAQACLAIAALTVILS